MPHRSTLLAVTLPFVLLNPALAAAQAQERRSVDPVGLQRLEAVAGGADNVSLNRATGTPRFVRLARATRSGVTRQAAGTSDAEKHNRSMAFFRQHASVFGLGDPYSTLRSARVQRDPLGGTHVAYAQVHRDVPVFAGELKAHFDGSGELTAVSGTVLPNITVNPDPSVGRDAAAASALAAVLKGADATGLSVRRTRLYVYRTGLAQGIEGQNHLAWEVEIGDGVSSRELVYVDAHTAVVLDRVSGIHDALDRRAYDNFGNFPATPFWSEGDAFPTASAEANNVIQFAAETYNLYSTTFGRDSFDGNGATMHSIFNASQPNLCPNAFWNGVFTAYCAGVSPDDVVGHEWTHAYTEFTHNLIYAWQPGALNEAYSDIFGEMVDLLNGTGSDSPGTNRTAGTCSAFETFPPVLRVNSPANIAGNYAAGGAQFGPPLTATGLTGNLVLATDAADAAGTSTTDGCSLITNAAAIAGNIAFIDRGSCGFVVKVKNAQNAGAVGVVIGNVATSANPNTPVTMGGVDPTIVIPSVNIGFNSATTIKAELGGGVNVTLRQNAPATTDNSFRWLVGEDATAFGGAIRDMWTPTCFNDPGKVSDTQYFCGLGDNGGVHTNSGVPNHGFALLVDGGMYNGRTVNAIGMLKVAHLYFRAMTVYQGPASDFSDHADALEQSCTDLTGVALTGFNGLPSGQAITAFDCAQVAEMTAAVELRTPPTQCNFQPLLSKNAPDRCDLATTRQVLIFKDDFERMPRGWSVSHETPSDSFTPRDWEWVHELPDREGSAFFGVDPNIGTCAPGGDESGVLHLDAPSITLASGVVAPRLTFDHWVSTESGFDGGNLMISVDDGAWQPIAQASFTFNPYNTTLFTLAQGNTNPLAGQPAFSGSDGGSVEGSWGRSHVDLGAHVGPNQKFRLRFSLGTDGCAGTFGWFMDDFTLYTCTSRTLPTVTINDVAVNEGNEGKSDAVFTVSLSHAYHQPVTLRYRVLEGTADEGSDYIVEGRDDDRHHGDDDELTVTIPALSVSAPITVQIRGDRRPEGNETFFIQLLKPRNATIGDGMATGTILNDDGPVLTNTSSGCGSNR